MQYRHITSLIVGLIAVFVPLLGMAQGDHLSEYKLNSGDKIKITVFDEPNLSVEERLTDAGTISYPFLGELQARGKTLGELSEQIIQGLKGPYLVDPKVNISILEYRQVYVGGEVKTPGGYPFQPGLTVQKAIALAGGFTERASRRKIRITHESAEKGSHYASGINALVLPGDILTVEESFF